MRPSESIKKHSQEALEIILKHHALNPRIFGSVARHEDDAYSDIDILIQPTDKTTLFDIGRIKGELQDLLGFKVDVATPDCLPEKHRQSIIDESIPL